MSSGPKSTETSADTVETALGRVREALAELRFGQVTLTVHDGQVVQIERIERVRVPLR